MKAEITKIEGNKIEIVEGNNIKAYELESWVKSEYVKLGKAEVTIKDGKVSFVSMDVDHPQEDVPNTPKNSKASTNPTKNKWEDDMVTFEDLLIAAHNKKIPFSIRTEMLQLDLEKKYALFKAQVIVEPTKTEVKERVFEGHGDATKENVTGDFIQPHFIRMAETRSIVRALRWWTNNGCAEEETNKN